MPADEDRLYDLADIWWRSMSAVSIEQRIEVVVFSWEGPAETGLTAAVLGQTAGSAWTGHDSESLSGLQPSVGLGGLSENR